MRSRQLSRSCSEKKRRRRKLCLEKLYFLYLFCAFLCPRENGALSVSSLERMAGTTRLELATSAVTGQRSNQLNYVPAVVVLSLADGGQCRARTCDLLLVRQAL